MSTFTDVDLDVLRAARTVAIETSAAPDTERHRAVIWIVVDDDDRVLVRSVRGRRGRWYRELVANPAGAVEAGGARLPIVAEVATDDERVRSCSDALSAKYRSAGGSLAAMLLPEVLDATLELRPG